MVLQCCVMRQCIGYDLVTITTTINTTNTNTNPDARVIWSRATAFQGIILVLTFDLDEFIMCNCTFLPDILTHFYLFI